MGVVVRKRRGRNLVARTVETLRQRIFACEPGTLIDPLPQLARSMEVGIVTVQQAARVLEHEGLLEVRRGPGGGYYGRRPDDAALERALDSFMRMHPASFDEALDMTSLLFNELATAAAGCSDETLRARLGWLSERMASCQSAAEFEQIELEFQELLFLMVRRPLFEMLSRVTMHYSSTHRNSRVAAMEHGIEQWRDGRRRIIAAILASDPELTRFEANRHNRAIVLAHLQSAREAQAADGLKSSKG